MPLSVVQAQQTDNTGTGQTSVVVNITTTAGNLLVCMVREGSNNTDTMTVTDSAGQNWTLVSAGRVSASATSRNGMFYMANSAAVTSVTANFSTGGGVNHPVMVVYEISGAATSSPEDSSVNATSASGTSLTSGSLTTSNANDILIMAGSASTTETWTAESSPVTYSIPTNGSNNRIGMENTIVSSPQSGVTATMTITASTTVAMTFAAFKAAAAASVQPSDFGDDQIVATSINPQAPEAESAWAPAAPEDSYFFVNLPQMFAFDEADASGFSFTPPPPQPSAEDDFVFYLSGWPTYVDDISGFVPAPPPIQPSAEDDFQFSLPTWIPHDVDVSGFAPIPPIVQVGAEDDVLKFWPDGTLAAMVPMDGHGFVAPVNPGPSATGRSVRFGFGMPRFR